MVGFFLSGMLCTMGEMGGEMHGFGIGVTDWDSERMGEVNWEGKEKVKDEK